MIAAPADSRVPFFHRKNSRFFGQEKQLVLALDFKYNKVSIQAKKNSIPKTSERDPKE